MVKVSVVMPVYNTKEEYFRTAIQSVLNQTFTDFELIIVDDGATDNLGKICEKYVKLITFVQNRAGHDLRYAIDVTKLGWKADENFDTGIFKTVECYLR